ncbi:MAG: 6-carboxytetrahydropterin synthase [Spiribacter sp.]|jgi:6-pyruvoyl-tetrahydropterin synthase|nr:6-carboxytetrahydropterin synthase [Spiribacter sp.]MDR9488926.1 6-carboxytetrahydropterin synthase [Spiribacter sp.]
MYSIRVREHFMIAHSFRGESFGPAQALHGATYVTDAEFSRSQLDHAGVVVDIALATEVLRQILSRYHLKNLDDMAEFSGVNTTTEFLASHIADALVEAIHAGELGESAQRLEHLRITLNESHVASASYERSLIA